MITLLEPILTLVSKCSKIIIPPLPRYIVAGCCLNPDHCTNRANASYNESILKELTRIRNFLKTELAKLGVTNYWVLDWAVVLGEPKPTTLASQVAALSLVSATDGVHFKREGYNNLADAIHKRVIALKDGPRETQPRKHYWRGFVSCEGSKTVTKLPNRHKKRKISEPTPTKSSCEM